MPPVFRLVNFTENVIGDWSTLSMGMVEWWKSLGVT